MHGEDADLALLHVRRDGRGQIDERPLRDVFEDERVIRRTDFLDLMYETGGYVLAFAIGNHRHAFMGLNVEAHADGIPRARRELVIEGGQHLSNCTL